MDSFENELRYQATMSMVRKMLRDGFITEREYRQIDTMFRDKYQPKIGTLLSEIPLTKAKS